MSSAGSGARPAGPGSRLGAAALALLAGCVAAMIAVPVWVSLAGGDGPALGWDLLPLVWGVAAVAWAVTVVPIVLFLDPRSWLFRPARAPAVGAICGALALLAAWSLWFLAPPWVFLLPPYQWDYLGAFPVAAVVGAVIWTVYTRAAARLSGGDRSGRTR